MFSSGTVSTTVCPPYRGSIWELGQLTRPRRLGSQPSSKHYYDYVNIELKGPNGSAGQVRIQNTIANYISLRIPFHLANLARQTSPNEFSPRPTR